MVKQLDTKPRVLPSSVVSASFEKNSITLTLLSIQFKPYCLIKSNHLAPCGSAWHGALSPQKPILVRVKSEQDFIEKQNRHKR